MERKDERIDVRKGQKLIDFIKTDKEAQIAIAMVMQNSAVSTGTS